MILVAINFCHLSVDAILQTIFKQTLAHLNMCVRLIKRIGIFSFLTIFGIIKCEIKYITYCDTTRWPNFEAFESLKLLKWHNVQRQLNIALRTRFLGWTRTRIAFSLCQFTCKYITIYMQMYILQCHCNNIQVFPFCCQKWVSAKIQRAVRNCYAKYAFHARSCLFGLFSIILFSILIFLFSCVKYTAFGKLKLSLHCLKKFSVSICVSKF